MSDIVDMEPYRPLSHENKEIRLLTVAAGDEHEHVYCTLQTVCLAEKPDYETISYVWCDASVRGTIYLNGKLLDVPASSEAAIRRVRLLSKERTVWIDAVCIDQEDVAEKGQQVGIMDAIFEGSQTNLICLEYCGVHAENVIVATEAVLSDARRETNDLGDLGTTIWDHMRGCMVFANSPLRTTVDLKPLLKFFSNPWFGREWVLQEAALAPSSVCLYEQHSIMLNDVLRAAAWLGFKCNDPSVRWNDDMEKAATMFRLVDRQHSGLHNASQTTWSLQPLLVTGVFAATEPRDHVFGVLGIYRHFSRLRQYRHPELPIALASPDYTRSLSEIFTAAVRHVVMESQSFAILGEVEQYSGTEDHPAWTSWLPRWHTYNTWFYPFTYENCKYTGVDRAEWTTLIQTDVDGILVTRGWIFTTVSNVTSIRTTAKDLEYIVGKKEIFTSAEELIRFGATCFRRTRGYLLGITLSAGIDRHSQPWSVADAHFSHQLLTRFLQREARVPR